MVIKIDTEGQQSDWVILVLRFISADNGNIDGN